MKKFFVSVITTVFGMFSAVVNAALPTDISGVTGGTGVNTTDSPMEAASALLSSGVGIGATVVSAFAALGVAWAIYSSFVEAREKGDWKKFGITSLVGVVLVVFVLIFAITAVNYAA